MFSYSIDCVIILINDMKSVMQINVQILKKGMVIRMSKQNLTLLTDFYELTMMQGYYNNQNNDTVIFDMFYRDNPCDRDRKSVV